MANTNCLEGIRCPGCGQEDGFDIEVVIRATVYMTDDGHDLDDPDGIHSEWDDDSDIECPTCEQRGKVRDFRTNTEAGKRMFPTNAERAERVRGYLNDYADKHDQGVDIDTLLTDFMTDLLHLVNISGESPATVHESAYYLHYLAEVEEEWPSDE